MIKEILRIIIHKSEQGVRMDKKWDMRKSRRPVFLVAALLLSAGLSFAQKGFHMEEKQLYEKYKMAVQYFEEGKELYNKNKFDKAEDKFEECLKVFPQHAQANFYLAHINYMNNKLEEALNYIELAKKNFLFMNQIYALGYEEYTSRLRAERDVLQNRIQQYQELEQRTTQQQEKQKISAQISQLQTELGTITSRLAEPLPEEKKVPADYFYVHGNIYFKLKKYQESLNQYSETLNQDPKHERAYNNIINLYFMAKHYQKALELIEQAEAAGVTVNPKLKEAVRAAIKN